MKNKLLTIISGIMISVSSANADTPTEEKQLTVMEKAKEALTQFKDPFNAVQTQTNNITSTLSDIVGAEKPKVNTQPSKTSETTKKKNVKFYLLGYVEDKNGNALGILGSGTDENDIDQIVVRGGEILSLSADGEDAKRFQVVSVSNGYITITNETGGVAEVR